MVMPVAELLEEVMPNVEAEDFRAVCTTLGQFAKTEASTLHQVQEQVALLAQHESGLTLIYLSIEQFTPRRHGTWCVVAPLQGTLDVQGWTEFIPPANFTGDPVSSSFPDVRHHCDTGEALYIPQSQLFSVSADHHIEMLLLFGEHPNSTWPESRLYSGSHHAERTLRYPEGPTELGRS
jgi:hypothetical protein